MGCFSFICHKSGKGVESTSWSGEAVHLFLLKDGVIIEEMFGNYNSYGCVFNNNFTDNGNHDSFEWKMDWGDVCHLMFDEKNKGNGIAAILDSHYNGERPTERSEGDPNQGWGEDGGSFGDTSSNKFEWVKEPYHKINT